MRKFWINSIPLLVVLFTITFGFTIAVIAEDCDDLEADCEYHKTLAALVCTVIGNANDVCWSLQANAGAACYEYHNHCS